MKTKATSEQGVIEIPRLEIETIQITLVGDTPLICHAWSTKAKRAILDRHMKKARQAKEAKSPEQDFKDSLYDHPAGGYGFPVVAFKAAAVDACSHVSDITKVEARGAFHIVTDLTKTNGQPTDLVKIDGEPTPREDMVKVGMGTADIRFRGEFKKWRTTLIIRHNVRVLSAEQIINLFNTAGFAIGVGEWRPQRDGSFGMFHVASDADLAA